MKNMKYKNAKQELEEILKDIETGNIDIDALSIKIKRAGELIKFCKSKLRETENEVEDILTSFDNNNSN